MLLSLSSPAFAFDLNIKDFFRNKVEESDKFITRINTKADQIVNISSGMVSLLTKGSFFVLEKRTGLSEQHKLYREIKHNSLERIGFGLGVVEGTKDFATETVSLLAKLDSLPARTINLAYNIKEKPQEYKKKVIDGGKMAAGVLRNPMPVLSSIYQMGKNTFAEAQKDPLKMGKLQGEVAVFGGTLLIGGGQVKSASTANKALGTAKIGTLTKTAARCKEINWGSLIPDFTQIRPAFGGAVLTVAGNGQVAAASIFHKTTKGTDTLISSAQKTLNTKVYPFSNTDLGKLLRPDTSGQAKSTFQSIKSYGASKFSSLPLFKLPAATERNILTWAERHYGNWARKLSEDDFEILSEYTLEFFPFNQILRKKVPTIDEQVKINKLSEVIHSAPPLQEDIIVFRGGSKSILGSLAKLDPSELPGRVISDKGFISTSVLPKEAKQFSHGVFLAIKVPKGTKGAYIDLISGFNGEREYILDKGQEFLIKQANKIHGKYLLEVDLN